VHRLVHRRGAHCRCLRHTSLSAATECFDHRTGNHPLLALVEVRHHRLEELGKTLRRQLHTSRLHLACYSLVDPNQYSGMKVEDAKRLKELASWELVVTAII